MHLHVRKVGFEQPLCISRSLRFLQSGLKFFNLVQPDVVIFGQKDAMQCVVIARMLEDGRAHVICYAAPVVAWFLSADRR